VLALGRLGMGECVLFAQLRIQSILVRTARAVRAAALAHRAAARFTPSGIFSRQSQLRLRTILKGKLIEQACLITGKN
jgi:hypothetical protein